MAYMLIHHRVKDYTTWRPFFDGHIETQKRAGLRVVHVLQSSTDPQEMIILFEASDLKKAQEYASSDDLRETMQKAGVIVKPEVYFLNEAGQPYSRSKEPISGFRQPADKPERR